MDLSIWEQAAVAIILGAALVIFYELFLNPDAGNG